jgi:signal transduction histidine kinase
MDRHRLGRFGTPYDLVLVVALLVGAVGQTVAEGGDHVLLRAALAGLTVAGLLPRRTSPALAAAWVAAGLAAESLITESPDQVALLLAIIVSAFSVAAWAPRREAVLGLGLLSLSVSLSIAVDPSDDLSNVPPTLLLFVAAPAGLGFVFHRRGRDLAAMTLRTEALERETQEAVERERARIARELHDVVSHAVTLIAVQAEAGQAVIHADPGAALRSLEAISAASRDALSELHALVGLLGEASHGHPPLGLDSLDTLVDGVRAAGLEVEVVTSGRHGHCRRQQTSAPTAWCRRG